MLTSEELKARQSRIGASDIAAIYGLSPFCGKNAYSVWLEKTGQLQPDQSVDDRPWIAAGNRLESVVLDYAEEDLGAALERNIVVWDPSGPPIASTLDAQVRDQRIPVEAKTAGIVGPVVHQWGAPGTDDVPDHVLLQAQTQLLCTVADCCYVYALIGGRGVLRYEIEPVYELHRSIREVAEDFFTRYVEGGEDPRPTWQDRLRSAHGVDIDSDPCEPSLQVVRRLARREGESVQTPQLPVLVERWQELQAAAREASKAADQAKAEVLAEIGTAEFGDLPDGRRVQRCVENGGWRYDRKAMEADGIHHQYAERITRPMLRIRKA